MRLFLSALLVNFVLYGSAGYAMQSQVIKPKVLLKQIKEIKSQERQGDELYFDVTVIRAGKPKAYYRIPSHPMQWSSNVVSKVKNISLWSEKIQPGHSAVLLLSLMEQDSKPFNPDDLIGVIRIVIENKDGNVKAQWTLPNQLNSDEKNASSGVKKFSLSGARGQYDVFLSLKK